MKYTKATSINGAPQPEEIVTHGHVARYIEPETLEFFRGLGGTEKVTKHDDGRIVVHSVSPDRDIDKTTTFTPIEEAT